MNQEETVLASVVNTTSNSAEVSASGRSVASRNIERALIAGMRRVQTERGEQVVITTENGKEIWATVQQVKEDAEEVRFRSVKKGDKYTYNKEERVVKNDSDWFVSAGAQTIKKYDALSLQDAMLQKMADLGMAVNFNK